MKKLALQDFEYHISQTTGTAAQDLVSAGRVRDLREVERHFWVAQVEETEGVYESEVIITPTKIKAFACECWSEPRKFMCVHIAATLLQVRKFLDQRAVEKAQRLQEKAAAQSEITRLSMRQVLPAVSLEALQEFIKDYARRDADFAQAFKTRFADVVDDQQKAFHLLLQSVLPKSGKNIREQEFRRFQRTLQDLGARAQMAAQEGNQAIVIRIALAVLEVTGPVVSLAPVSRRDLLVEHCTQAFNQLSDFYESDSTPPERKDVIWQTLFSGILKMIYPLEMRRDIIRFMATVAAQDSNRLKDISDWYFEGKKPFPDAFIHLYLVSLAKKGMDKAVVKILDDLLQQMNKSAEEEASNLALVRHAMLELYYIHCYPATLLVLDYLQQHFHLSASRSSEFDRIRFNIAEVTHDIQAQLLYLRQAYTTFGHQETIDRMKHLAGTNWPEILAALIAQTEAAGSREKTALLLANESDPTVFSVWLEHQKDPTLTLKYHRFLSDTFLIGHLVPLFSAHLNNHFGRPGAVFVRDILMELMQAKRTELVRGLIQGVLQEHPGRSGLKETLEEVWANMKGRQFEVRVY